MICATIDIWPFGDHTDPEQLAKVAIWNRRTGDQEYGDYGYVITDDHDARWGNPAPLIQDGDLVELARSLDRGLDDFADDTIVAHGTIDRYPRRDGAVGLLAAVLADAGADAWYQQHIA